MQVDLVGDLLGDLHQEPAVDVHGALRAAGRPARVGDEQRVLGVERLASRSGRGCRASSSSQSTSRAGPRASRAGSRRPHDDPCRRSRPATAARSAVSFIGTTCPLRREPSAVISTSRRASASRAATASAPKPQKIGTQIAPSFEHGDHGRDGLRRHRQEDADRRRRRPTPSDREARAPAGRSSRRSSRVGDASGPRRPRPPTGPRSRVRGPGGPPVDALCGEVDAARRGTTSPTRRRRDVSRTSS